MFKLQNPLEIAKKIRELIISWKEEKRRYFRDNIEPIYKEFAQTHEEYLREFKEYQEIIKNSSELLGNESSLYTMISDNKQNNFAKRDGIISRMDSQNEPNLSAFLNDIYHYLNDSYFFIYKDMAMTNAPRSSLMSLLESLSHVNEDNLSQYLQEYNDGYISLPVFWGIPINSNSPFTINNDDREVEDKIKTIRKVIVWNFIEQMIEELQNRYSSVIDSYEPLKHQFIN